MATYSKELLSGSTSGRGIKVAATAIGSGTTIHTALASPDLDLVTLFAMNSSGTDAGLTVGWGGTTSPDDLIVLSIPAQAGLVPVAIDLPLTGGLIVKAAGSAANVLVLFGSVNRVDKP